MDIPFACVAYAFALQFLTKVPVGMAQGQSRGGYDNRNPREQQATLVGWGRRALGAHQNAFEAFPGFAAAVLAAHAAGVPEGLQTGLAVTFVVARTLHPALYIADVHIGRSLAWFVGLGATLGLFALAVAR